MVSSAILSSLELALRDIAFGFKGNPAQADQDLSRAIGVFWMDTTPSASFGEEEALLESKLNKSLSSAFTCLSEVKTGTATEDELFDRLMHLQGLQQLRSSRWTSHNGAGNALRSVILLLEEWEKAKEEGRATLKELSTTYVFGTRVTRAVDKICSYRNTAQSQALSGTVAGSQMMRASIDDPQPEDDGVTADDCLIRRMAQIQKESTRVQSIKLPGDLGVMFDWNSSVGLERAVTEVARLIEWQKLNDAVMTLPVFRVDS